MPAAVVFDLEFTAWEGSWQRRWLDPGEFKEVVQVGAVKVDVDSLAETETLNVLVRPRINAVITPYLENLTGITNAMLSERAIDFTPAYAEFTAFAADGAIAAFGRDDLVLEANLRLYGIAGAAPMPPYTDIIPWLHENGIDPRGMHACDVGPMCGAIFEGRKHDALDDARSVLAGIRALVLRGARNPLLDPSPG